MTDQQDKISPARELLSFFRSAKLDQYGSVIDADQVRHVLGIQLPEIGTREQFTELAMLELSGVDYVRKVLLREGKYLAQTKGNYRILLPNENAAQVASYMASADKKLKKALTLTRNTPSTLSSVGDSEQTQARIMLKRQSIKDKKVYGNAGNMHHPTTTPTGLMPDDMRPSTF